MGLHKKLGYGFMTRIRFDEEWTFASFGMVGRSIALLASS